MTKLKYNISEISSQNERPAQFLYSLWEVLAPIPTESLNHHEKVALRAWDFDSTHGNGIRDQIVNENYDTVVLGLEALKELNNPRLDEYSASILSVFNKYSIQCNTVGELAELEKLSIEDREKLYAELDRAEEPFEDEIWGQEIIIHATKNYIQQYYDVFLGRA